MQRVLIVDDDEKMNNLLNTYLSNYGFIVFSEYDPLVVMDHLFKLAPDIIILDVMMPGKDGFELLRDIRRESRIPVIMLTARGEVTDRIVGLEVGADDYMGKPFEPREILARIQAILRRTGEGFATLQNKNIVVDNRKQQVIVNDIGVNLTAMEFYLLKYFIENRNSVVSRDMIFNRLKGSEHDSFDRSIDVLISRLRQKIGDDPKHPEYIRTVRGRGYIFIDG